MFDSSGVEKRIGDHIADYCSSDAIVEFQNSPIAIEDVQSRQLNALVHNRLIIWVVNAQEFADNISLYSDCTMRWKWMRKTCLEMVKHGSHLYLDGLDHRHLVRVKTLYESGYGSHRRVTKDGFAWYVINRAKLHP